MLTITQLPFLLSLIHVCVPAPYSNVCKNFKDYMTLATNPNCYYNPDVTLDPPELIKKYVGREESYNVTTEDGYILQVFRMPRKDPKGVILLQHPMFTSSRVYVMQGNESTGYLLWQAGYDVWMGNQRGTRYGLRHVSLTANDDKFWDFSLDETGYYDTAAIVNLVRTKTNSKIILFGHSMGTSNGLIYASSRPDEAKKSVERFIFASTSAYYVYSDDPLLSISYLEPILKQLGKTLGLRETLPNLPLMRQVDRQLTRSPLLLMLQNAFLLQFLGDPEPDTDAVKKVLILLINFGSFRRFQTCLMTRKPQKMLSYESIFDQEHVPTQKPVDFIYAFFGTDAAMMVENVSWKLLLQYLQIIRVKDRFQMYDYGPAENQRRYGSRLPPEYPIWNISVPIHFVASYGDTLTSVKDAELLYSRLPAKAKSENGFGLRIPKLSHGGIQNSRHRVEIFVKSLIKFLTEIRQTA